MLIYDGDIALYTPLTLWLSSGMRAMDHAIEMLYNPRACEVPQRLLSLATIHELRELLPKSKADPSNADLRQRLLVVAFGTLFSVTFKGGMGLSHALGTLAYTKLIQVILLAQHMQFHMGLHRV
jgi:3-oxoacid CoA-transferase